jgi:hypothetical protein
MIAELVREKLEKFNSIGLEEIESVRLMNRIDTKYAFSVSLLPDILDAVKDDYRVLEIKNTRLLDYSSTYFDTSSYFFYYQHVTGKLSRHKVRLRQYLSSGESFLEIKRKNNRNRTVKWRIGYEKLPSESFDQETDLFLRKHIDAEPAELVPSLVNSFKRATLVSNRMNERITIDIGLSFSSMNDTVVEYPHVCILEMKRSGIEKDSAISAYLKDRKIRKTGFSKYCIGTAVLNPVGKKNTIKPKLLKLERLRNQNESINNSKI